MAAWIGVASADHVARGRAGGFMQLCHGKGSPLARLAPGDRIFYYSPARTMGGSDRIMAFTAAGFVADRAPYRFDMGGGFVPSRRDVDWDCTEMAPIRPLLPHLALTRGLTNWGQVFRYGLVRIDAADAELISDAMRA